jgi:hypothetical protein
MSVRSKRKTTAESADFSFSTGAVPYADKAAYVANQVVFNLTALEYQAKRGYNGVDRWAATVMLQDGKTVEVITLPTNDKRNAQLEAAKNYIDANGSIPNLQLAKAGSAFYFRPDKSAGT